MSRASTFRARLPPAIAALGLWLSSRAYGLTLDDLKGYSIEVTATTTLVNSDSTCGRSLHIPCSAEATVNSQIYIGQRGNIFVYTNIDAGDATEHTKGVNLPDRASDLTRGQMGAWTVEGGNLTHIRRQIEGYFISTIAVDPSRTACAFTTTMQPDPTTHRLVRQWVHGWITEVVSMNARTAKCTIQKGNIFATDQ